MKNFITLLLLFLFVSSCNESNPLALECDEGFSDVDGVCVADCDEGLSLEDGECVLICSEGFSEVDGACVEDCDEGLSLVNGECVLICSEGFSEVDGECVTDSLCESNEVEINGTCYNIQSTTNISFSYCNWTEIPSEIGELVNLEYLQLQKAWRLTGTIPPEIGNLVNLRYFIIGGYSASNNGAGNSLSGSIPDEISNLANLENLTISYSNMEGTIPSSFGNLTALTRLNLFGNNLSGTIPQVIWDLPNLTNIFWYLCIIKPAISITINAGSSFYIKISTIPSNTC